eukprot:6195214-Pleurochrysis_carterae.AAC.1
MVNVMMRRRSERKRRRERREDQCHALARVATCGASLRRSALKNSSPRLSSRGVLHPLSNAANVTASAATPRRRISSRRSGPSRSRYAGRSPFAAQSSSGQPPPCAAARAPTERARHHCAPCSAPPAPAAAAPQSARLVAARARRQLRSRGAPRRKK